jgi:hypothetical protein
MLSLIFSYLLYTYYDIHKKLKNRWRGFTSYKEEEGARIRIHTWRFAMNDEIIADEMTDDGGNT